MLKVSDQVVVRRQISTGTLVRIGSVLRLDPEQGMATVHFPVDHTQAQLRIEDLVPTSEEFPGRTRVQHNPLKRGVGVR